jgi:hypothetical protein
MSRPFHADGTRDFRDHICEATSFLFLDFDGVLHPVGATVDRLFCQLELLQAWLRLHPPVMVVISSSWRIPHALGELKEFFSEDLRCRVIGATGVHWRDVYQQTGEIPIGVRHEREKEVTDWLRSHDFSGHRWAALEDEVGLYRTGNARVVYCSKERGLTERELTLLAPLLIGEASEQLDVLYLDFDGVLHPESVFVSSRQGIHIRHAPGRTLFENAQILVDELDPFPNVKLVLSTSWVRHLGYDGARRRLPEELGARCIGATYHSRHHRPGREDGFRNLMPARSRGQEVLADVTRRRPHRWLAVDDTDDGWSAEARGNVVISDPMFGISTPKVRQVLHRELARFT